MRSIRHRTIIFCSALCWLLCLPAGLRAQELVLPVQHLGVGDGLPQGSVYSIFQDRQGFMWIGTGDGLARWDGRVFRTFRGRFNDSTGRTLAPRMIAGPMLQDAADQLWMTAGGLICYNLRTERFGTVALPAGARRELLSLTGISPGGRIIFTDNRRVYALSPGSKTIAVLAQSRAGAAFVKVLLSGTNLWYATRDTLWQQSADGAGAVSVVYSSGEIRWMFATGDGALHVWLAKEILILKNGIAAARLPAPLNPDGVFVPLLLGGDGTYYGADRKGLCSFDPRGGTLRHFATGGDPAKTISSRLIVTLFLDRAKNLWVGTEGSGLDIVDTKGFRFGAFPQMAAAGGKPRELMVKSLLDAGGKLWIGTFSAGLFELDRATGVARHWAPTRAATQRISILYRDSAGRIWMNREEQIGIVHPGTKAFLRKAVIPDAGTGNLAAFSFCEMGGNAFLLGSTYRLHCLKVAGDGRIAIRPVNAGSRAATGLIAAIMKNEDGSYYLGKVRDGFFRVRIYPERDSLAVLDEGLHATGIRAFCARAGGRLVWMATEHGLVAYEPQLRRYRTLDEGDGLSNSYVYGIVPEGDTALWISTNKGINRVAYRYHPGSGAGSIRVRSLTAQDGLQSNEFNTGAFCALADGGFAFGGVSGVNWFYPQRLAANPFPPQVALTAVRVNEQPFQSDTGYAYLRRITLPYRSNTLSFEAAALSYTAAAANRYAYMLQGVDPAWVQSGPVAEARYANLAPGSYRFMMKAANNDGVWSTGPAVLDVVIVPPWWQTLWARIVAAALTVVLVVIALRAYIRRRVAARLRALEKQQAVNEERLRISRDMHDELGTGLTKIALLSEVAKKKATAGQPAPLSEIAATSRALTQKIGEIVWTLNPRNDTLDTLAAYIREYLQDQYDDLPDGPAVLTSFPDPLPHLALSHGLRQAMLLITKEAVNNAVKYAGASVITVRIALAGRQLRFTVEDDGQGFAPEAERRGALGGNGLVNMAARMREVNGRFEIITSPGAGARIIYSVLV